MLDQNKMPKTSKKMKAPAPRKGSKVTAAAKPLLVRNYKINDPRTLREREKDENRRQMHAWLSAQRTARPPASEAG